MDDERITLRMGTEEVQAMDSFLEKNPSLGTRSLFIRTAIREYINRDAGVSAQPAQSAKTGVFVEMMPEMYEHAKETAKGLWCLNVEEYVRSILIDDIRTREEKRQVARNVAAGMGGEL
jgi:hypothetical protein